MSNLDTNHVISLDLIKDRANSIIKFGLADVETSDFYLGLYNNGTRIFDENYIVTLYIVKPNGTFRNIKLEPKEGLKKYYCNLPDTLKNIPGEYLCQAIIFDNLANEKKVSKSKFKYSVDLDLASEIAGIIGEEEQESILTNILNRLLTLENPVEPYATQKHVDECVSTLTEEIDTIKVKDVEQDDKLTSIETKNSEQDTRLTTIETKDVEQDGRLVNIESKNTEQDNRLNGVESKNIEQDGRLTTIEAKDVVQDGRLDSLENRVDGIDEKIVNTIEPSLDNHGNRLDALENKDVTHESKITDIETKNTEQDERLNAVETKNTEQDNRLTNIEGIDTTQNNRLDALEAKDITHESRITNIEAKNTEQDGRLDVAENRLDNIGNDITNTMQPIIDAHTSRLDAIEAIDIAQNTRLDNIEVKNQEQDDRLLDIEKVNKKQDIDIKCLYGASQTIDVTEEGNSIYLQNSNNGFVAIDEIKGNTLVNCNKEPDKELILNGNINTSGDNNITITEGVDGGLVDVALEGNTLVNVSKTKESTGITKSYTVENSGNHIALQGDVDGNCRPVITGNTLVNLCKLSNTTVNIAHLDNPTRITGTVTIINAFKTNQVRVNRYNISDNTYAGTTLITSNVFKLDIPEGQYLDRIYDDTSTDFIPPSTLVSDVLILEGDYTNKPIPDYFEGLQSSFEDNLVTQEMVDNGEEVADNLGKYRVDYKVTGKNKFNTEGSVVGYLGTEGAVHSSSVSKTTDYLTISPNTTCFINCLNHDGKPRTICFYDIKLNCIGYTDYNKATKFSIPFNSKYIRVTYGTNCTDVQIEEGDTATEYEPYKESTKTLYLNSPLLEGDTIEEKDNGIYHVHRSKLVAYTEGDEASLITDKVNTLHQLETPTYELIEQSNLAIPSYANGHLDFTSAVPVEKVEFKPFSEELTYLYPSTSYTVQFISTRAILADLILGGTSLLSQFIVKGLNRISITTPSELVDNKLTINGNNTGANIMEVIVTDTNRELIYFEGMKSVGECEELQIISINSDKHLANTQQLTHEPLRAVGEVKDKYVLIDGKWYIERKCGIRAYQEGDKDNYKTDLINTVYPLEIPTYEEIDYRPLEVYSGTTRITTNSVIPTTIIVKNHGYNCLLKPSTTYTISSNLGLNTVTTPSTLTEDCLRFMDTDTSDITTMKNVLVLEGDWTTKADLIPANFSGMESAFEQEYDEEKGKYKVNIKAANEDKTKENNITFYLNEPLRGTDTAKDRIYIKDDKVVVERNCGIRAYEDGDFGTYPTDKVNTVYPLAAPTYEEVEYNDAKLFIESFKNSTLFYNSNVPVSSKLYYSYSVPIVDTVAQTADISNQQDSMIIDMAVQVSVLEMMTL